MRVAFQGVQGAYSEMAAKEFFGPAASCQPFPHFARVFAAVVGGKCRFGVVPIENSIAGSIHQNYDLLQDQNVWICGEYKLKVEHNLLVKPGSKLNQIRRVYSHPQALAQCAQFFRKHRHLTAVPYFDTAGSAQKVACEDDLAAAAIASRHAAAYHELRVLRKDIQDFADNYTRFLIIRKSRKAPPAKLTASGKAYKTSVVFALKNIPGCLHKCLSVFAIRDIDLFKIESRPIGSKLWRYLFYLDFAGSIQQEAQANALKHLAEITDYLKVLGSYESCQSA